jgi:hypothetical protein
LIPECNEDYETALYAFYMSNPVIQAFRDGLPPLTSYLFTLSVCRKAQRIRFLDLIQPNVLERLSYSSPGHQRMALSSAWDVRVPHISKSKARLFSNSLVNDKCSTISFVVSATIGLSSTCAVPLKIGTIIRVCSTLGISSAELAPTDRSLSSSNHRSRTLPLLPGRAVLRLEKSH